MDVHSCTDEGLLQTGGKRRTRRMKAAAIGLIIFSVAIVVTVTWLTQLDEPRPTSLTSISKLKSDSKIIVSLAIDTFGFDQDVVFHRSGGFPDNEELLPELFGNLAMKSRQNATLSFPSTAVWYWVSFAPRSDDECHFTVGVVRSEMLVPFRYVSGKNGECRKRYVVESKSAVESNGFSFSFFESMEACVSNSDCHVGFACSRQEDNGAGYCKPVDKPSGLLCDRDDNCPPFSVCKSSQCEAVDVYGPQGQECLLEKKEETCPPTFECKIKKDKKKAKCSAKD